MLAHVLKLRMELAQHLELAVLLSKRGVSCVYLLTLLCLLFLSVRGVQDLLDDIEQGKLDASQIEQEVVLTKTFRLTLACT